MGEKFGFLCLEKYICFIEVVVCCFLVVEFMKENKYSFILLNGKIVEVERIFCNGYGVFVTFVW